MKFLTLYIGKNPQEDIKYFLPYFSIRPDSREPTPLDVHQHLLKEYDRISIHNSKKRHLYNSFADFLTREYGLSELKENEETDVKERHHYGWYRVNSENQVAEVRRRYNRNYRRQNKEWKI